MENPLHVVFGHSAMESLKRSFEIDGLYNGKIISLNDDLSVGPIIQLADEEGVLARKNWWGKVTAEAYNLEKLMPLFAHNTDLKSVKRLADRSGTQDVCIWLGKDGRSKLGFMWLMYQSKNLNGNIYVMDYPKENYDFPMGSFPFTNIALLKAQDIVGLKKYIRLITKEEMHKAVQDWEAISKNDSVLRIVDENNRIAPVPASFYDENLLFHCNNEFQKAARVIGKTLSDFTFTKNCPHDSYLNWRLKVLSQNGALSCKGVLKRIRDYEVKLK